MSSKIMRARVEQYGALLLVVVVALLLPLQVRGEYFRHLTMNDGLSQPTVFAITQDCLGRMWFGTREGVNVYDGSKIEHYRGWIKSQGGKEKVWIGNDVRTFGQDSVGNIYMVIDRDVIKYDIKREHFDRITNSGEVHGLAADEGTVVYISNDTIYTIGNAGTPEMLHILPPDVVANQLTIHNSIYYVGSHNGLYIFDRVRCRQSLLFDKKQIYSTYMASDGTLYVSVAKGGLYRYLPGDEKPQLVSLPKAPEGLIGGVQTRDAVEGPDGKIWYGSFTGLFSYDPATGVTDHIKNSTNLGGLNHSSVLSLYCDREGNIWVGTYYGGVNFFSMSHKQFVNFDYEGLTPRGLFLSAVVGMVYDRYGDLWFGTDGAGACCVDPQWNIKTQLSINNEGGNALRQNNVKALAYDSITDRVFIGTHLGGLSYYDIKARATVNLIDTRVLPDSVIDDLVVRDGRLYVAARTGIYAMDLSTGRVERLRRNKVSLKTKFDIDDTGNIYLLDRDAVVKLHRNAGGKMEEDVISRAGTLGTLTSLVCTSRGLLVGTLGNGLFYFKDYVDEPTHFDTDNSSIRDNYCYALSTDGGDHVYILAPEHIVKMNIKDCTFDNLLFHDFFPDSHIIVENNLAVTPAGDVLVGSTRGVTVLHDTDFQAVNGRSTGILSLYFSSLKMGNHRVTVDDGSDILQVALPFSRSITLDHDAGNIDVEIGFNDYNAYSGFPVVEYKLEGVDDEWRHTESHTIKYNNLLPGSYKLQARLPGGSQPITLDIVVESPWYNTWWAWLIYLAVIGSIVCVVMKKSRDAARLRMMLKCEKLEHEQNERFSKEKLIFFNNISHEFQTPLTLIISHIDLLINRCKRNRKVTDELQRIREHSQSMSQLVTQLLEFNKLQLGYMKLKLRHIDATKLLVNIASTFKEYADSRRMTFIVEDHSRGNEAVCDPRLIERVVTNIISNAFKYTPDGGTISCWVEPCDDGEGVKFVVSDTGRGISQEELPYIFDRYYKGDQDTNGAPFDGRGNGIGLAYVKTIVDCHHGTINVTSKIGEGSTFEVIIPSKETPYAGDDDIEWVNDAPDTQLESVDEATEEGDELLLDESEKEREDDRPLILIVEDQTELRRNLMSFFSIYYNVAEAADGLEGLEKTRELAPTLIISDVMMPRMSGTEMCRNIKSDLKTCHIPVILLTALDAQSSRMEGLKSNADDYVTKPFDSDLLLARVENLLRNRKLLQSQFEQRPIDDVDMSVVNPLDRELLKRVTAFVEQHIDDQDLDIPMVSREMGMSLSLFFNKFKAVTGMTPNNFILRLRLQHAATLLEKNPYLSVTEVSEKSGFATVVYFRRVFKKQYGVSPQQYRKED